jgi:hypothetical protein
MQLAGMRSAAATRNADNLAEVAEILAAGLQRLFDRKSSPVSARAANSSLDWEPPLGGDVVDNNEDIAP